MCAVLSWMMAQILKIFTSFRHREEFSILHLIVGSGGMPSSHAAVVMGACFSCGILYGFGSPLFAISAVVAVVVMLAIRWVGLLLINAMLILPAAAARNVARSTRDYHVLTLVFGVFAAVLGLLLSYFNAVATGPMVVLVLAALFFGTFLMREK